jgi:bifunctional UDP-N-acetylglucosamine pyrophosphorylase/glucosamine-1-phosphate N-acetyltransferase
VPPGALAVTSGPQRHYENWAQRKRAGTPQAEAATRASEEGPIGPHGGTPGPDGADAPTGE